MSHGVYALQPDTNNLSQLSVVVMPAMPNRVGGVMPGAGTNVSNAGVITLAPATASSIGGVLIGANISVAGDGTISLPTTISGAITFSGAVTCQATPFTVTSASTTATVVNINNTSARNYAFVNYGSGAASPGFTNWLGLNDTGLPQNIIGFASTGVSTRCAVVKLPQTGVLGWATDNNTPATNVDIGLQRSAAGQLQVSDTNGNDMDLRARSIIATKGLTVTAPNGLNSSDAYLRLGQTPVATQFNAKFFAICVDPQNPTSWWRLGFNGTQAVIDFNGTTGALQINNAVSLTAGFSCFTSLLVNPTGSGTGYLQVLTQGQFTSNPALYSSTGTLIVQAGLYVSGNVSGASWTAHGSGGSLAEVREHMRQAPIKRTADAKDDEPAPIPVGAVNFIADEDGFHLIGKLGEGEIQEAIVPWTNPMPPRPLP